MRTIMITSVLLLGVVIGASAQRYWMPLREIARQGYVTLEGVPAPRYQFRYVQDYDAPETCLLVLTDEETGQFAITAIPRASCDTREVR